MYKHRHNAKVDNNQKEIVNALRKIPGLSVELGHDDVLIGYKGITYWYEIKSDLATNKAGKVYRSKLKESQKKLLDTYQGHYKIVSTLDEILEDMEIT